MNNKKTNAAILALQEALKEEMIDTCTSVTVFFNCENYEMKSTHRTPVQLKKSGISMRNIKWDFITDEPSL